LAAEKELTRSTRLAAAGLFLGAADCLINPPVFRDVPLLVDKLPIDPDSRFWVAIGRYRAGKYEEADRLFSAAAKTEANQPPHFQTFHAMIKAMIHDRETAKELLSKAQAALKKEILDDYGTEHGG
jgi:hypothetical protein